MFMYFVVVTVRTIVGKGRISVVFVLSAATVFFVVLGLDDSALFPSTGTARPDFCVACFASGTLVGY